MALPVVRLAEPASERLRRGHLWLFSNELAEGFQDVTPGALVEVHDAGDGFFGIGTCNPHSLIAVRLFAREPVEVDAVFFHKKLTAALKLREAVYLNEKAYRLIFSEGDGLPGLVIDRYNDFFVLLPLTAGIELLLPQVQKALHGVFPDAKMLIRRDGAARAHEGLPIEELPISNESPVEIEQDGVKFLCDLSHGQKTGFFFDQRVNRRIVTGFHPQGDVLDLFCHTGGFGFYALKAGANRVVAVDSSEAALSLACEGARRNEFDVRWQSVKADTFEWLKTYREKFDWVILDPPALVQKRSKIREGERGYRDVNARAMQRVRPGGFLATSSCSGLLTRAKWMELLADSVRKAKRQAVVICEGTQATDHPVLPAMPETNYLKFAILRMD
ncbi:MAG: class I SAM-dependent rRNA methyltransferase [bacterium]